MVYLATDGRSYVCILGNTNRQPPNSTHWQVLADVGPTGATGPAGAPGAVTVHNNVTVYTYGTPGSYLVTLPTNASHYMAMLVGAGGGGKTGKSSQGLAVAQSGSGGGGAGFMLTTPLGIWWPLPSGATTANITVGTGGAAGSDGTVSKLVFNGASGYTLTAFAGGGTTANAGTGGGSASGGASATGTTAGAAANATFFNTFYTHAGNGVKGAYSPMSSVVGGAGANGIPSSGGCPPGTPTYSENGIASGDFGATITPIACWGGAGGGGASGLSTGGVGGSNNSSGNGGAGGDGRLGSGGGGGGTASATGGTGGKGGDGYVVLIVRASTGM